MKRNKRIISFSLMLGLLLLLLISFTNIPSVSAADASLVGQWHMDNNWNDSSGNNNNGAAYNGAAFSTAAKVGTHAGSFDGVDDYVAVGNLYGKFSNNSFTIEAWVKLNDTGNGAHKTIAGGTGSWADYEIGIVNNQFFAQVCAGTNINYVVSAGFTPALGQWYHVAGTFDGSVLKLYVNGVLMGSTPAVWRQANGNVDFWLGGGYCCSSYRLNGLIDEVTIYNRPLSADEIKAHYDAGSANLTPPVAVWHMDNNWQDSSGNGNNGTAYNGATFSTSAKVGTHAGSFDGANDYVNIANLGRPSNGTYEAWIYPTTITGGDPNVGRVIMSDSSSAHGISVKNSQIVGYTYNGTYEFTTYNITANSWYHIVWTFETGSQKLYVNGELRSSGTKTTTGYTSAPTKIGYGGGVSPFSGLIEEVAIYNRALTAQEIQEHYQASIVAQPTVNNVPSTTTSQTITLSGTKPANTSIVVNGTEIVPLDSSTTWQGTYTLQGGANTLNVVARNSAGYNSDPVVVNVTYLNPPIAVWHMDNNWQDSSGNGNNGTANGAIFSTNAKSGTHAGSFDGVNDYIDIGDKAILRPANITVEAWVRINGSGTGSYPSIVATNDGGGAGGYILRYNPSNGKFEFYIYRSVSWKIATTDSSVSQGAWHHIVGRYDGSEVSIWLDGVKQAATSAATGIDYFTGTKTSIGAYAPPTYSNYINGLIDDLTIYNRALSAQEIQEHYQASIVAQPTVNNVPSTTTSQTITLSGTKPANTSIVVNGTEIVPLDSSTTWQVGYTVNAYLNALNIAAKNANGYQSEPVVVNITYSNAPIAIWHMDNNWQDSSGNGYNGIAYNGATFSASSKIGTHAGSFDGGNDYVQIPRTSFFNLSSDFTISFWLKRDASENGNFRVLMGKVSYAGLDGWYIRKGTAAQGSPINLEMGNNSQQYRAYGSSSSTPAGSWQYYVFTRQGANWKVYLDGSLQGSGSNFESPYVNSYDLYIGRLGTGAAYNWYGLVDEVAIYNRALTAQEIQEHYQASIVAQPTVNNVPSTTTSQTITLSGTKPANTSIVVNGTEIVPLDSSTTWQGTYTLQGGANTLNVVARNSAGYNSDPVVVNVTYLTPPIAVWHMDNNWQDSSGNGNHGTAYNGATFSSSAKIGTNAGSFNGSNYVDVGNSASLNIANAVTVEAWIKPNTVSGTQFVAGRPYSTSSSWNSPWVGWHIGVRNGRMATWINISGVDREYDSGTIVTGSWQHVVMTYDGTWRKSYINGVNVYSNNSYSGAISFSGNPNTVIGIRSATAQGEFFNGLVDEVAVYNRALSASEILEHYQMVYIAPPAVNPVTSPTASQTFILSGTKAANTSIRVNGMEISALNSLTTWQGTYTLQSGSNTLNITAMDAGGYQSQPMTLTVIYDNTAPTISSSIPSNNASVNTPITSVTVNLADTYSTIDLTATTTGATVKNSSSQDIPGAWAASGNNSVVFTPTNPFAEGTYTVTVYPTDSFGNKTTVQITFNYDATAPPAPTINAVVSPTNISAQVVSGTKSSDTSLIIITTASSLTIGTITYPTSTTWSVTVSSLKEGANTITAYAKDAAGNQSAGVSTIIIYDSTPPSAPVVNTVASPTKDTSVTIAGAKDANSSILINGTIKVTLDSSATWQSAYTLQAGSNTLNITSKDMAGNQSATTTVTVILDNKSPVIESSAPVNNSDTAKVVENIAINLTDTYSSINLETSIIGATVKNSSGQTIAGVWTTSGTKTIIFTPSNPFPEDTYTVTIYPTDSLGNKGQQQFIFINHDITSPVTTIALSGTKDSAGWYSTAVTVTMTATDSNDGSGIDKTEYSLDNITWNLYSAPFVVNKDGISNVKYRSTDKAGNIETAKSQEIKINLTGIVGWWRMDNNWQDSSVVGNNGTANGAIFSTSAKIGTYAGSFDGVDDYVEVGNSASLLFTTAHTVESWVKFNSLPASNSWVPIGNVQKYRYGLFYNGNGFVRAHRNPGDTIYYLDYNMTPSIGLWYHFVEVFDGTNLYIYISGELKASGPGATAAYLNQNTNAIIGRGWDSSGTSNFNGLLDEVIIYNRALSADEIKAHFDAASVAQPVVNSVTSPTGSQTITLSGTKTANTSIRVNGMEIVPLDNLTTWQGTYTLQSGSNTLNITAMDAGGYQSASVTITIIYDNIPPTISGSIPSNNASVNTPITSVTVNLADTYSTIDLTASINGAIVKNALGQAISGTWTTSGNSAVIFTPSNSLSQDTYTVTIYPTDSFGNKTTAQIAFNYDTTAPPPPAINAVVSPTNIAAQVVSGTKSSDTAAITFATSPVLTTGTVSYPTTTSWSVLVSGLKDGENIITAYAKDPAGNQSAGVSASIIYDFTAPAAPVINALMSPTKNTSVALTGTKEANTYLYVNGIKTPVMFIDTAWSYTVSLNEGTNTFTAYAKDEAGNQSPSASVNITRDTTPPVISTATPSGNSFINQAGAIDILLADSYSSVDLTASITGAILKDPSGNIVAGSWSISNAHIIFTPQAVMSANGAYTVTIYPADSIGNTGTASFSFTMDTTPPQVQSLTMNPASPHKAEPVTFTFIFNEDVLTNVVPTVTFGVTPPYNTYQMSGSWTNARTWQGAYTFTNTTGDGIYKVMVSDAKDKAGNIMTASEAGSFVLDTGTPAKPVIDPITTPTKTGAITISGTKPANTGITINGAQKVSLDSLTTWNCVYTLTEGANNLSVRALNAAGNESIPVIASVVLDTVVPRISASSPSNGDSMNLVAKIDILLVDDTTSVDLNNSLTGASVKLAGQSVSGAWSIENSHLIFTPTGQLAAGAYTVTMYPVDILGNKATINIAFTVDVTPSLVQSLTMTPSSPHKAEAVTFAVTFNEDMTTTQQPTVTFTKGTSYPTYTITGSWTNAKTWSGSYTLTSGTGDGTYTVSISGAKDKAGNTINPQDAGTFILDTISPSSPAISAVTTPTKTPNQAISGTRPADTSVIINGIERVSLSSSTSWSYTYPLSEGSNNISVTARDAAGNDSSPVTTAINLDTTPPSFNINTYKNPSPTLSQALTGTKEAGCIVKLNGVTIFDSIDQNTTWSHTVTLTEGLSSHFVFTASDALGNTATKAIDILYDASAPGQLGPGVLVADGSGKGTEITLSWAAYVETPDIAYYRIYMSTTNFTDTTGMTPIGTTNKGVKTFKITGLTQGSTYYFAVVPIDISGNFTPLVNTATGVPNDTAAPENVSITSVTAGYDIVSGNYLTLKWNPSVNSTGDLSDQVVYFDDGKGYDSGTALGKIVTTYTKTGLNDATKYKFKITVKDALAHESSGVIAEGVTRLPNPAALSANPGNARITLSWSAVSSPYVKQYNIYRLISDVQQKDVKTMLLIKSVSASTYSYADTGLTNGTDYQYAVTTLNTYGAERTDVLSITARPRMDNTGPVIGSLNITQGQVITAPITISASATDAESSVGKIELYIDGVLIKTQTGNSISYFWNVVDTTDGNHTIKLIAYDQYGNITEAERQVVVSLAPPSTPSITGHTIAGTTPKYLVNITGTAPLYTTVILKVNGTVVSQSSALTSTSTFTFTSVELKEGDNFLAVKSSHRGGESQYSADYKIVVDTGAPQSPVNLTSQVLTGGAVRFSWQNAAGEIPSGYNLYMSTSSFASKTDAGVTKANTAVILYLFNDYTPPSDSLRYYAVTSVDSAGNESGISNIVSASSDRVAPYVHNIKYYSLNPGTLDPSTPLLIAGPGSVKVELTINEALKELPFLSLEPNSGSPIIITLTKISDTLYEGTFSVTSLIESGPTTYKFSGKDMTGNRGTAQGTGITIDASGPVASIQSPLTVLQITPEPVTVNMAFNESSVTVPVMELRSSSGLTAGITGFVTSDNGIHWTGTVDISALPEGNAEFKLKEAKDKLGNIGTTVSSGKTILIYRDSVPPPDTPSGLTTKTGRGGVITLTWNPIGSASSYNLYRRAQDEITPVKIKTGILGSPSQDTPPSDGIYYYSVTSVGLLNSESTASAEVQGVSDRTGPSAPINLGLILDSTGVVATWIMDSSQQSAVSYQLYRSNSPITTTSGITQVVKVGITRAVDVSPSRVYRFYAVTAFDTLGNEGPLSETKEINFPVSPVRDLVLEKIDDAAPRITWVAPYDGDTIGYHIYRNNQRITSYPVTALSYTDGYYSRGNVTYGVSAVNNLGVEGPIKEVMLPELSIGIKQGTVLRRGLLETIPVIISLQPSAISSQLTIDTLSIKVGTAPSSSLEGPFTLITGSALQVEKVAATTADAPSFVSVLATASWSPTPGATVRITKTLSTEVVGSSTALEIFSDPLIRGTDGKIRLKVNNIGTALMEFLTSENSGVTTKVKITLKDEDGNVLSAGYLDQRVGSAILNTGSYAVARLNPNENIITDPITITAPQSAPYKVIIEAKIENTYYHYGKTDQVTAPGMTQSIATTISETAYRAFASPEKTFYPYAQPVIISGQAISNSVSVNSVSGQTQTTDTVTVPYVPVKLGISIKGFDRFFTVTTDAAGAFTYTFTPGANEAGLYTTWAVHPDIKDRAVQATFAIAGLSMSPETATVRMARNRTIDIPLNLYNYGGGTLTGLTFETTAGNGITANVINGGDNLLTAGEQQGITLRITSSSTAPDTSYATMKAYVNEGLSKTLNANISIVQLIPVITTSPSFIDTGMVRGNQKIATFNISNTGEETLRNARIEGPSTSWMSLTVNRAIGDIQPGVSKTIGIMFNPPSTLAQGVYDDRVVIYSDNHIPYTYHIQVTVTSNAVGNVLFDVLNELMEDVPNASITLQHQTLTELIYSLRTAADGTIMLYDIPEGRYSFNISATGHKSYSGTFVISPGITTTVPIALEVTLVQVEWSVTPIVIQDRYEIVVTQTFQTNVPTPVLVIEPASITVPELAPGQVFNGEFTLTNYGLIGTNEGTINFPTSFDGYDLELLGTIPKRLNAMQRVTVPYRITRRMQTALSSQPSAISSQYACNSLSSPMPSFPLVGNLSEEGLRTSRNDKNEDSVLLDEVKGYGGSPCYGSKQGTVSYPVVICAGALNETSVTKTAAITFVYPIPGSNCSPSTGGSYYGGYPGSGGGGGSYGGGTGGSQTGGGGTTSSSVSTITPIASETCFYPRCTSGVCQNDTRQCTGSSVILANGTYEFSENDLTVPAPAMPVEWTRSYRSNRILKTSGNYAFGEPGDGPLGFGWMTEYFARIENGDTYIDGEGLYTIFQKDSSGNFLTDLENGLILKKTAGGYELTEIGGKTYVFNAGGKLTAIKDLRGNSITLIYDSNNRLTAVKDVSGRTALTFSYNAGGRISNVTDIANRTVNYEYDTIGNLTKAISPQQTAHSYTYNNNHGITTKSNPLNETYIIEYQYADRGIISKITDPAGKTMPYIYDFKNGIFYVTDANGAKKKKIINEQGKLIQEEQIEGSTSKTLKKIEYLDNRTERITDATGNTTTIQRDEWRNVIKSIDGEGNETKITYNTNKKPLTITDALGNVTRMEYDQYGNLIKITQAEGKPEQTITSYVYDNYNQVTSITINGLTTTYVYNEQGRVTSTTDARGNKTFVEYDAAGNPIKITDPPGNIITATYDFIGKPLTVTDPNGKVTTNTYNAKGNLIKTIDPLGNETSFTYDFANNIKSTTDAEGKTTAYEYDGTKRLVKTTDASGGITTFSYETGCASCGNGDNLTSLIDPKNQKTTFTYDNGLMIKETNPLGKSRTYIYNKNKQITGIVDYKGQMTTFAYDAIGRLKAKTTADDTFAFTYDSLGRMTSAKNQSSDLSFAYDLKGNFLSEKDNAKNTEIKYTYDNYGNKTTMTGPMGTTTYAYDNFNRLMSITDPSGKLTKYTNDKLGRRTKEELPNSIAITYAYDDINRLTGISTLNSELSTLNSYVYAFDKAGNKTSSTTQAGEYAYGYDQLYQLTSATHPDQPQESYVYDSVGNRNPLSYKHSAWNQILENDKFTYTYDDNGNRTEKIAKDGTLKDVYTWNAENRLIKFERYNNVNATTPTTTASYKYDALGRRIEKSVIASGSEAISTRYLYDGISIIAETDVNGAITTTYIQGEGIDEPISMTRNNRTYYYHRDSLGSITSLTDEIGNIVQEYKYDSFGNITYMKDPNFIQPFTFTGREYDPESNTYYYRERTYDSDSGTFISVDPLSFAAGDVNLFRYVRNRPTMLIDPMGLDPIDPKTGEVNEVLSCHVKKKQKRKETSGTDSARENECIEKFFKCMGDIIIAPGWSTWTMAGAEGAGAASTSKAWSHAASRNLTYPLKSSIVRSKLAWGRYLGPVSTLTIVIVVEGYCISEEIKCMQGKNE